jgi:exopolysaccharide biosynthesis polyprenyl glycosylphosphotransferase
MFKRFSTNYIMLLFLLDLFLIQISLRVAISLRYMLPYGQTLDPAWPKGVIYVPGPGLHLVVAILWCISFLVVSVYVPRKIIHWVDEVERLVLAHSIAAPALAGLLYLAKMELPRLTFIYFYLLVLALLLSYRAILRSWHRLWRQNSSATTRILIVGAGRIGQSVVQEFRRLQWPGIKLVGFLDDDPQKQRTQIAALPVLGKCDEVATVMAKYPVDEVVIALPRHAHARLNSLVAWLWEQPVRVRVVPDYSDLAFYGATIQSLGSILLIGLRDPAIDGFQRCVKRLMDIVLSTLGLILMAPVMVAMAVAIKLENNGPIFYRAKRVGENGRLFTMLKFRSMVVGAEKMQHLVNRFDEQGNLIHKTPDDPRVTRVGRFIRRTSIDELPQLMNVLKGDMSLIGPRPELPWLVERYEPWQRKRFAVPQGITGWWQVNGRSDKPLQLHTEQDLYYIQNYSLWLDMQILWKTAMVILRGKGAY